MPVSSRTVVITLAFALGSCAPVEQPKFKLQHAEQRGRIDANGLRFVVMPDAASRLVEVDVRYEVGSREDPPGKAGLAHLVEHLLFHIKPDGPNTPTLKHYVDQITVNRNAYTTWDKTHYTMLAAADQIDALLKVEAMRLHFGCESITEAEFALQREVVRNEIRQRYGTPQGQLWSNALAVLYPRGHAYQRIPGGDDVQIASLTLADACEFVKKYYVPERATVLVAGGVDVDATVKLISNWFAKLAPRKPAPRAPVAPVRLGGKRKTIKLDIERPMVLVMWAVPQSSSAVGDAVGDAMGVALSRTAISADDYEFATSVTTTSLGGNGATTVGLVLELPNLGKVDQALDFTWKAARNANRLFHGALGSFEEWRARRQASFIIGLESLEHRTDAVGDLVQFRHGYEFLSRDLYVFRELDAIRQLGESSIRDAAVAALDPAKAQVIVFEPSAAGIRGDRRSAVTFDPSSHEQSAADDVDPTEAARKLPVPDAFSSLSAAKRFTLGNGLRVALLPVEGMPVVTAELVFDVGTATDADRPLFAAAAAGLLGFKWDQAWSEHDLLTQLPARIARSGIDLRCSASEDETTCFASGANIYLDDIIAGLEQLMKRGEYDQESIERMQKRLRTRLALRRTQERNELDRQQLTAVLGAEHPYTKSGYLTRRAIDALGSDELTSFRNKHYSAANATLVVAGSFDLARAEAVVRRQFGGWSKGQDDPAITAPAAVRAKPTYVGVVGEAGPQLEVSVLYPSAPGVGGEYAARLIVAEMLTARAARLREQLGATYGIYARRHDRRGPSYYEISGTVDAARAGEALRALREAIASLRAGKDFDADFVRARRNIVKLLLAESNTSTSLARRLARIGSFDLPPDYFTALLQQAAAATPAQIKALIASELDPKLEAIVTMGDRATITRAFAEAGIKDTTVIEPKY